MTELAEYVLNRRITKWWHEDDHGDDTDFSTEPGSRPKTSIPCDLLDGVSSPNLSQTMPSKKVCY